MQEQHRYHEAVPITSIPSRHRHVILALNMVAHAAVIMAGLGLVPLAPFALGDLVSSRTELGVLVSALLVGSALGSIPGGWLADRSVRWTLFGGQVLLGTMVLALTLVSSFHLSIALLLVGGLGFGAVITSNARAVASWFPMHGRAAAMGLTMAAAPMGNIVIASGLPALGQAWGWRQALLLPVVFVLASAVMCAILFRQSPGGLRSGPVGQQRGLSIGEVLRRRDTWLLAVTGTLMGSVEHAFRTYFLLHVTEVALVPVVVGGWLLAMTHGCGVLGRLGWGIASDRWLGGNREVIFASLPVVSAFSIVTLGLGWGSPWILPVLALVFGLTGAGWVGLWSLVALDRVSPGSAGKEMGVLMTFASMGSVLGPILFGRGVDLTGSYQAIWLALAAASVPAAVAALMLRKPGRQQLEPDQESVRL